MTTDIVDAELVKKEKVWLYRYSTPTKANPDYRINEMEVELNCYRIEYTDGNVESEYKFAKNYKGVYLSDIALQWLIDNEGGFTGTYMILRKPNKEYFKDAVREYLEECKEEQLAKVRHIRNKIKILETL